MKLSGDERRALGILLGLVVLASAARWLERPRTLLEDVPDLDIAALEVASRAARPGSAAAPGGRPGAPAPIDPNMASAAELQRLPGVGAAMAQRIIEERERGAFTSVADLQRVRGIGPAAAARLAGHVTLPADLEGSAAGSVGTIGGGAPGRAPGPAPSSQPRADAASPAPVDLNRATAAELQAVPGVGPALAARLAARRDSLGGFRDWSQVDATRGVGPALLARLMERTVLRP